jgi:ankyrin repeat protein
MSAGVQPRERRAPHLVEDEPLALVRAAPQQARAGDAAALEVLLDRGVPADVRTEAGDSLLMLAAYHGHQGAVRLLLQRGADPELRNDRGQSRAWTRPGRTAGQP